MGERRVMGDVSYGVSLREVEGIGIAFALRWGDLA